MASVAALVGLDVVQLHGDEPPDSLPRGLRVWKAFRTGPDFAPARLDPYDVEAFLLDAPSADAYGGTGRTFEWSLAAGVNKKVVLAGGLDENNVRAAIRSAKRTGGI